MIYLDNAATSFQKPKEVETAMVKFLREVGANPGRSGHRLSIEAARILYAARESTAELFNVKDPLRIVFCLNATEAINLALCGILRPNDHVITSSMEHNSVMRPLRRLEQQGVELSIAQCSPEGFLDPENIKKLIKKNTALIVMNHASNVTGSILPVSQVGKIAREHNILFLVDSAQTGGCYPIDINRDFIDLLVFSGHKNLFGPQGTGGLIIGDRVDTKKLSPLKTGGTGSRSEHEVQPDFLPDIYESGTLNTIGLAGLGAGIRFILEQGINTIRAHEMKLTHSLINGLKDIPETIVYGGHDPEKQTGAVSFNINGISPSEISTRLDEEYEIMCRVGLHCSPAAHKTIGTFPDGAVRLSISYFNTPEEISLTIKSISELADKIKNNL
jgi:cysteine desulfurase family protein